MIQEPQITEKLIDVTSLFDAKTISHIENKLFDTAYLSLYRFVCDAFSSFVRTNANWDADDKRDIGSLTDALHTIVVLAKDAVVIDGTVMMDEDAKIMIQAEYNTIKKIGVLKSMSYLEQLKDITLIEKPRERPNYSFEELTLSNYKLFKLLIHCSERFEQNKQAA